MADNKPGPKPGTPQARRGGEAVRQKYGVKYFTQIGELGGEATKAKGPEHYAELGKKGGEATKRSHGQKFYQEIGRKGGKNSQGGARRKKSSDETEIIAPTARSAGIRFR